MYENPVKMKGSCITRFASNLNKSSQEREPSTNYNSTNTKMESKETETETDNNYVSMLQVKRKKEAKQAAARVSLDC